MSIVSLKMHWLFSPGSLLWAHVFATLVLYLRVLICCVDDGGVGDNVEKKEVEFEAIDASREIGSSVTGSRESLEKLNLSSRIRCLLVRCVFPRFLSVLQT